MVNAAAVVLSGRALAMVGMPSDGEGDGDGLGEGEGDGDGDVDGEGDGLGEGEGDGDGDGDGDGAWLVICTVEETIERASPLVSHTTVKELVWPSGKMPTNASVVGKIAATLSFSFDCTLSTVQTVLPTGGWKLMLPVVELMAFAKVMFGAGYTSSSTQP
jgi:hypothetical protein